jgi:hypothetical protein
VSWLEAAVEEEVFDEEAEGDEEEDAEDDHGEVGLKPELRARLCAGVWA